MSSKWTRRMGLVAIAGAIVYGSVGCAQERDPINRVQSSALSKHFYVGADLSNPTDDPEFYMRNTVIDVPSVRFRVSLIDRSIRSRNGIVLYLRRFSRTLSYTTTLSLVE